MPLVDEMENVNMDRDVNVPKNVFLQPNLLCAQLNQLAEPIVKDEEKLLEDVMDGAANVFPKIPMNYTKIEFSKKN